MPIVVDLYATAILSSPTQTVKFQLSISIFANISYHALVKKNGENPYFIELIRFRKGLVIGVSLGANQRYSLIRADYFLQSNEYSRSIDDVPYCDGVVKIHPS